MTNSSNDIKKTQLSALLTAKDFMRWGASEFMRNDLSFGHGMATALDEAVYLVLFALQLPVDTPETFWDTRLTEDERKNVIDLLTERAISKKPAAYLTHQAWFCELPFYVDERVLVPRSPIGELIQQQFSPWIEPEETHRILDLCTGSGCIGIACLYAFPHAQVDLADISQDALDVAAMNIERHDVAQSVTTYVGDGLAACESNQYDLIVCNPPYVDAEDMSLLTNEFKHEPSMALESGHDGLDFTRKLLSEAADYLTEEGVLIVEVGNSQYALQEAYSEVPFHWFEFENGGHGVFLLTAQQLKRFFN